MASRIDDFGTPEAYNHYAVGWAHAMDTPYQWTKQVASHWGGTRNGTIVHWPERDQGEGRDPHAVPPRDRRRRRPSSTRPGCRAPTFVHGIQQMPLARRLDGVRRSTTRAPPSAARRSTSRCSATAASTTRAGPRCTRHSIPWVIGTELPPLDDDVWELYGPDDWTQAHDLAAEQPEKLAELQRCSSSRRAKYNVLPARRPARRALQPRPRRPAAARPRQPAAPVRRHGPPDARTRSS